MGRPDSSAGRAHIFKTESLFQFQPWALCSTSSPLSLETVLIYKA